MEFIYLSCCKCKQTVAVSGQMAVMKYRPLYNGMRQITSLIKRKWRMAKRSQWSSLPSIIIVEILSYLSLSDRLNASATCKRWRSCLFHPSLWRSVSFKVKYGSRRKSRYLTDMCGRFLREAKVDFSSEEPADVRECLRILEIFGENINLEKLALRPSSCQVEWGRVHGENQLERLVF